MTLPQILSCSLVAAMMAAFVWGRLRYDVVALLALLAGVALGIVPAREAFKGFSDDIVIIVASALIVSAAVARSGLVETALARIAPALRTTQMQVAVLVFVVAAMSAIIKNIGALAMMLPIAYQLARKDGKSPSVFLMPMAFASLLGGIVTLVGTSPNVIVARVRQELGGEPFAMFDFTPVGIGIALAGCAFLSVAYRLLPKDRQGSRSLDQALDIKDYVTEARLSEKGVLVGKTVADLRKPGDGEVEIAAILRDGERRPAPLPDASLRAGDILLLRGEPKALERVVADGELELVGQHRPTQREGSLDPARTGEAIVTQGSLLEGLSAAQIDLHARFHINLLGISRAGERFTERLRDIRLRAGDVVLLQGDEDLLPERLRELGLLPLAARSLALGSTRRRLVTGTIVALTVIVVALGLLPVAIAFFAAAVLLLVTRALTLRDAYDSVEAPILVMLAALIPVSDSLRVTGATDVFAGLLAQIGSGLPGWGRSG